jgi:hypothetical protein
MVDTLRNTFLMPMGLDCIERRYCWKVERLPMFILYFPLVEVQKEVSRLNLFWCIIQKIQELWCRTPSPNSSWFGDMAEEPGWRFSYFRIRLRRSSFFLLIYRLIASNKILTIGPLRSLTLKIWLTMYKSFSCYENATTLLQLMDKEW